MRRSRSLPSPRPRRAGAPITALAVCAAVVAAPIVALAQPTTSWSGFQGGPEHPGAVDGGPEPAYADVWALPDPIGGITGTQGLSGVAVAGGVAVTVGPDEVIAVEAATGEVSWRIPRDGGPSVYPAIVGEGSDALAVYPEGYGPNAPSPDASGSPSASATTSGAASVTPGASPSSDASEAASGVDLVAVSLASGEERWRVELPSASRSGVTAGADAVYVGGVDGSVTAVEAETGAIRWTQPVGSTGLQVPVALAGDLVLVSATGGDDRAFAVVALRADDGSQAWRYEPGATVVFGSAASVADGVAYVTGDDATVRAIDAETGGERWMARANDVGPAAPPVLVDDLVVVADVGGQVTAFDRETGEHRWDHALNVGRPNVRSPAVATSTVVLVPTVDGELYAVETASGDLVSQADLGDGLLRSLAIAGDVVIGVRGGREAGLVGIGHDPDGSVFRTPSPTTFDPATFATNAAIAIVPIVAIALLGGRLLARRVGPARFGAGTSPHDPLEDGLAGDDEARP